MVRNRLFAALVLSLAVVPLTGFWLPVQAGLPRRPAQQDLPPQQVTAYSDFTLTCWLHDETWDQPQVAEQARVRDTLTYWNVGQAGGPDYAQAVWGHHQCACIDQFCQSNAIQQVEVRGTYDGGPYGSLKFNDAPLNAGSGQEYWIGCSPTSCSAPRGIFFHGAEVDGDTVVFAVQNPEAFTASGNPPGAQPTAASQPGNAPGGSPAGPGTIPADDNDLAEWIITAVVAGVAGIGGLVVVGGGVVGLRRLARARAKAPAKPPLYKGTANLKTPLASGPPPRPPAQAQPSPGSYPPATPVSRGKPRIYGTGTPDDPFRDDAAFKINPDGSVSNYPEHAGDPPRIFGRGTRDDPYRNHTPGQAPPPNPPPAPPQPAPKQPPKPKKTPTKKSQPQQKNPPKTYYLIANTNQLNLTGGQSQPLLVEAWEVTAGQGQAPCPANLQIIPPPGSGLLVSPDAGQARIQATVSAGRGTPAGSYTLQVQGTAPDGQLLYATIGVTVTANRYELRCNPPAFELRAGQTREVEISLWRFLPNGGQEIAGDVPVTLDTLGAPNPLVVDPPNSHGQFKCQVRAPRDAASQTWHIQARACPPDTAEEIQLLVSVRVLPSLALVVVFNKPLWEPNTRTDLYTLGSPGQAALDELATGGGELIVRAWGVYRGAQKTIECPTPVADGACRLERGGQVFEGVWDAGEWGYVFTVTPLAGYRGAAHQVKVDVPIPVHSRHGKTLDKILLNTGLAGTALGHSLDGKAEAYIQAYMDYIAQTAAATLQTRQRELLTWLYHAANFTRYTAESVRAFRLALNLHASAYRRFFDALINAILEILFLLIEKVAAKAWRAYVSRGKEGVKEGLEAQTKQTIEAMLEKETRALAEQGEKLAQQIKAAAQEGSESQVVKQAKEGALVQAEQQAQQLQKELAQEQARLEAQRQALAEAKDEAAQRAAAQQVEALEQRIRQIEAGLAQGELTRQNIRETIAALEADVNRRLLEVQKLANQLRGVNAQAGALKEIRHGVRQSTNLGEISNAIQNVKPGAAALDPQLKEALDAFVDGQWKQLESVISYLENNRHQLANAGELIAQVRGLQAKLRTELGVETIKMTQNDFVIKPEFQEKLRQINQATTQAQTTMPTPYQAMDRSAYEPGALGWVYHKLDQSLEWLHAFHDWARNWSTLFALTEDLVLYALEKIMQAMVKISNLLIGFLHSPAAVRSMIEPGLRRIGVDKAKALGLRDEFFVFPWNALNSLGHSLHPHSLTASYTNKALMIAALTAQAEQGYTTERNQQKDDALDYFELALLRALQQDFGATPAADSLGVSSSMLERLAILTHSMEEYVQGFATAQASGQDALTAVWARRMNATEWTAQDVETMIEWIIWAVQALAILLGAIGIATGVGAAAGAALLGAAGLMSLFGSGLRVAIVTLWTLPNIAGFQYDVVVAHALMVAVLYDGLPESLDNWQVERYDAGPAGP